jgi:signal transduction histidine kinase
VPGRFAGLRRWADDVPGPRALVVDATIAVLCYLATVAFPVKAAGGAEWSLFGLAGLASLPLVWRRRYPITVAALVGVGTIGLAATGAQNSIPIPYGQLVATYTLAALASPLWRLVGTAVTATGVVATVIWLLGQGPATLGTIALLFVAAYAMGTGARARRDRISMLEERAQRLAEEREAAEVRERERIAREIHDIVAHSVSLMVVQAEAGAVLAGEPDKAAATFETISETGREAMHQLDRALGVLRGDGPTRRPAPGLADVPELVEQARRAGLAATFTEIGSSRPVSPDLGAATYRLVQEALTNTIKHARAGSVAVRLEWRETTLEIKVADDGRGPSPGDSGSGRGLTGMRERVEVFGGRLHTGPVAAGGGFRVTAVLPTAPAPETRGG